MIERLSGDYIRGNTKAIQDILEIFEYIQSDLAYHHKRLNGKLSISLLKTILNNREKLREDIYNKGFFRWNSQKNDFEWAEQRKDKWLI